MPTHNRYEEDTARFRAAIHQEDNFDLLSHELTIGEDRLTFFYVDGFVKDAQLEKLMTTLLARHSVGTAHELLPTLPQIEAAVVRDLHTLEQAYLGGMCVLFASSFLPDEAMTLDLRTYPMRAIEEPESDRVMQGARDGFVETLIANTALIRRRIRDPRLCMRHFTLGGRAGTDVVLCYLDGVADPKTVRAVARRIEEVRPRSLTLGFQSLSESFLRRGWWNPFPKIRSCERPDTCAAQLCEGSVVVLCDTSPQAMILPTSVLDYLEQTDDFYFPPLTGTYLRLVRTAILLLSVFLTPLWVLALNNAALLPPTLAFLIPDEPGALPILLQLYLVEIAIDGLKIASLNTPSNLSGALSIIGGLILGDFAVGVGWLSEDVILYMAFVAVANFAGQNHELGYALKFVRLIALALTATLDLWGLGLSVVLLLVLLFTNPTVGDRPYTYPLYPLAHRTLCRLLFRLPKRDFETRKCDPHPAREAHENNRS